MTKWPSFVTKDLDPDDDAELMRRWQAYDQDMKSIIAKGGVHQDDDGWWVETATGELIGPDPEIERPRAGHELEKAKPFVEIFPQLAESIRRSRGRPPKKHPKEAVTLRLDPRIVERFKKGGDDWRARMVEALEKAAS